MSEQTAGVFGQVARRVTSAQSAQWRTDAGSELVQRQRYLVVPAEDLETLHDRCTALEASMRRMGLALGRVYSVHDPRAALGPFLTPRLIGPALLAVGAHQPLVTTFVAVDAGAALVHRLTAGFAASVLGFPDRQGS